MSNRWASISTLKWESMSNLVNAAPPSLRLFLTFLFLTLSACCPGSYIMKQFSFPILKGIILMLPLPDLFLVFFTCSLVSLIAPFVLQYFCCPAGFSITPQKDQPAWCFSFWWVTSVLHLSSPFSYSFLSLILNTSSSFPLLSLFSSLFPFPLVLAFEGQEGKMSPFTFLLISSYLLFSHSSLLFSSSFFFSFVSVTLFFSFLIGAFTNWFRYFTDDQDMVIMIKMRMINAKFQVVCVRKCVWMLSVCVCVLSVSVSRLSALFLGHFYTDSP